MKSMRKILLSAALVLATGVQADIVVREVPDTAPGKGYGGVTGLMVGSVGGPLGAVVGVGVGLLLGGEAQEVLGLEGKAYEVRAFDGSLRTVRSPNQIFEPGDEVVIQNGRLIKQADKVYSMSSL